MILAGFLALKNLIEHAKRGKKRHFDSKRGLVSRGSARKVTFLPLLEKSGQTSFRICIFPNPQSDIFKKSI